MFIIQHRIIEFQDYKEFYKYLKQYPFAKSSVNYKTGQYWYPADEDLFVRFLLIDIRLDAYIEEVKIALNKIPTRVFLKARRVDVRKIQKKNHHITGPSQ